MDDPFTARNFNLMVVSIADAEVKPALPLLLLFFFLSLGFSFLDNRQLFKVALNCGMDNNYIAATGRIPEHEVKIFDFEIFLALGPLLSDSP